MSEIDVDYEVSELEAPSITVLVSQLQSLLASLQVFALSIRGFHWNVMGNQFFDLHQAYGALYDYLNSYVDVVAELVRQLGAVPLHSFIDYISASQVGPATNFSLPQEISESILDDLNVLLQVHRGAIQLAQQANEFGMVHELQVGMARLSKEQWFYSSHAGRLVD